MELQIIQHKIFVLRDQKVMFDFDLAELYEVETRILNQAVKRNIDIFPIDLCGRRTAFSLHNLEWKNISSQIVMTSRRPKTTIPYAFTEHGVAMLANVLKSKKARLTSIAIVRAFIGLKEFVQNYKELDDKLKDLETQFNQKFGDISEAINYLFNKDKLETEQKNREKIGFK